MERRKSGTSGGDKTRGRKIPGEKPKRRASTDQSRTALGETPLKRGLKTAAQKPPAKRKGVAAAPSAGQRELRVNVKTAKGRKVSSTLWLDRQLNDPYVARAKSEGYRSRAAYKLIELDAKFHLLRPGARVVDLGCAPGGWLQAAVKAGAKRVVGIDYLEMPHVPGAEHIELDFLEPSAPDRLKALLGGPADLVLSDMAAPTTGHKQTDHMRIIALADAALDFAIDVLSPGGTFVAKVFQGGATGEILDRLKANFETVRHGKPQASRADSSEVYVVAKGFKGRQANA
jgi:23S rRNA (uridine2552-2'-O)-methyltransferase